MSVIPFRPVGEKALRRIAEARLSAIGERVRASHGAVLSYTDELVDNLVKRSVSSVTGARTVDHVLRGSMMPALARFLLERMADDSLPERITVGQSPSGAFTFSDGPST
jgi:type VI secretion system protein VasG